MTATHRVSTKSGGGGSQPPIRVTHVVFDYNGGGLESLIAEMAARCHGSPLQFSLITLSGREGKLGASTRHIFDQFHVIRPVPALSLALPLRLAAAIRESRPDVVHLHTGAWYKGARAARLAGAKRVVYTEHGREHDDPGVKRWIDRRAAALTDAVIAVSGRLSRYLSRQVRIPTSKIRTIHNGVDTSYFTPGVPQSGFRQALGIPSDALVIGSVGRLEYVKGYDVLLEATALLRPRLAQPFRIVLFGDGSQREELTARAARLGIDDITHLPGWTSQSGDAYRLIDLFALASRSEGQSVSLMEAMSCGVVPVVTDVGSNAEMLGPQLQSHVVPSEAPQALANALLNAAESHRQSKTIGAAMRARAVELYGLDRMVEQYEHVYRAAPVLHPIH